MKLACLLLLLLSTVASAATLQVGPGKPFATPQAAMTAASHGDVIEIESGLYKGAGQAPLLINKNVTIRGVRGRPQFDCDGAGIYGIGCWVVDVSTTDVTIDNVEIFDYKTVTSASCIRVNTPGNFTLRGSFMHDCLMGVLTSNQGTQKFWFEDNTFTANGAGDGYTHNIYVGHSAESVFIRNRSYNSLGGQLYKGRSTKSVVAFNDFGDPSALLQSSNQEVDLSCGGDGYIVGNKIHQSRGSANQRIVTFGNEGCQTGDQKLTVVGNTVYNEAFGSVPTFLQARKQAAVTSMTVDIRHNVIFGPGTTIFYAYDGNLTPDLSTNVVLPLPTPPVGFAAAPENVSHSLDAAGIALTWRLPPGATGVVIYRNGVEVARNVSSYRDTAPLAPDELVTYGLGSLQGTAVGRVTLYTVRGPRAFDIAQPLTEGWYEVAGSRYQTLYPAGTTYRTQFVVEAWSGAAYNVTTNCFQLFGGGDVDYTGNELMAACLTAAPHFLAPATTPLSKDGLVRPITTMLDGKPSHRKTYGGQASTPSGAMYIFGGQLPTDPQPGRVAGQDLWLFDGVWTRVFYDGVTPEATYGNVMFWDNGRNLLWIKTTNRLYTYTPATNVMAQVGGSLPIGAGSHGALDASRDVLVYANGTFIWEIPTSGASVTLRMRLDVPFGSYPGVTYDEGAQRVVIWNGGSRFGLLTGSGYLEKTVPGGPGYQTGTGTVSRFVFVPALNAFALQNRASQNLFVVKVD